MLTIVSGIILTCILCLSVPLNGTVLWAFYKSRSSVRIQDAYVVSLAISDLLQALIGYPAEIRSLVKGEPQQSETEICRWTGFFVTWLGLVSINHLMFLSVERALVISLPFSQFFRSKKFVYSILVASWLIGFFWAFFPLIGWSSYATEKDKHRCSINWVDETPSGKLYVYLLFAIQFLLPVIVILAAFIALRYQISKMINRVRDESGGNSNNTINQSKTTNMIIVITVAYFVAWTPYAVVSLYTTMTADQKDHLSEELVINVALAAKSSTLFNPIIYAILYSDFRQKIVKVLRMRREEESNA